MFFSPSPVAGGSERVFASLTGELRDRGVAVHAAVLGEGPLTGWLEERDVPLTILPAGRVRNAGWLARTTRALRSAVRKQRSNVLISNLGRGHLIGVAAARGTGAYRVWWSHNIPRARPFGWDRSATLLGADLIVAVSEAVAAGHRGMRPRRPVTTIHNAVDFPDDSRLSHEAEQARRLRCELGWADNPVVALVGRLQAWKGQETFLRAAALLSQRMPSARFLVVGGAILGWEGDYEARLRALARDLELDEHVRFVGHQREVGPWYSAADAVVNASVDEPFGLVILEAMVRRKPIVATRSGGIPEIITHGREGLLVTPNDPRQMADAVQQALSDEALALELGSRGRSRALADFGVPLMADRWEEALANRVTA
jgi:glycosyltransferase involved in cell wall biosynthesis